ncbi:hypothetical protein E3N88_06839 [Mikania micrantha]|uniref:Reverse transcriptase domain-containing protein n=1 Tax=Mikania micrantha TaxID=192012 RepID=A0A5N6PPU3_9ASTR|nr:hypothetical protein E3N88_06839 [Mikania micrantha]
MMKTTTTKIMIWDDLEVYVDDLVIKSKRESNMLEDIEETLNTLRSAQMKLNPEKCSFGVQEWKFLGVMVTKDGIKANPCKVQAILDMESPKSLKEVQRLNGRLIALSRFLSRIAERSLPFITTLKKCLKKNQFKWTQEAELSFKSIKQHLSELPSLTTPVPRETIMIYLSSEKAISTVLLVEQAGKHIPIYFISRTLKGGEERYASIEKATLALVYASRRLRRYF